MKPVRLVPVFVCMLGWMTACGEEAPGKGDVEIRWQIPGTTCQHEGLVQVRVDLSVKGEVVRSASAACSLGRIQIPDVKEGRYDLHLAGLDEENVVQYEAFYSGLKVKGGSSPSAPDKTIQLQPRMATLRLRWTLPPDNPICGFSGISVVEVNIRHSGMAQSVYHEDFPCDPGTVAPEDLPSPLVSGGWLEISPLPPGDVRVLLYGLDPEDNRLFIGEQTLELTILEPAQTTIELRPCNDDCV